MVPDVRIVFSNQPLAYREAMASVVQTLRPALAVSVSDPQNLDAEIARIQPQLVVCSDLADSIRSRLLGWIMLYPDGQNLVTCSIAGQERQLLGIDLSGLLALVDEVAGHFRRLSGPGTGPSPTGCASGR